MGFLILTNNSKIWYICRLFTNYPIMLRKHVVLLSCFCLFFVFIQGQVVNDTTRIADSLAAVENETVLRITNINPYFTLHVDSLISYQLAINKDQKNFYWYLKNSPVGLKINKDNGLLTFRAEKSYFLSGKLKYDEEYTVKIGVQSLLDPKEKIDTGFTLVFYNTEIALPKVKPTVETTLTVEEGEQVSFKVQCESGNFPIENILFSSNITLSDYKLVRYCDDEFTWTPPFDFVKETDSARVRIVNLGFIGTSKFKISATANVRIIVKDELNYPPAKQGFATVLKHSRKS